jgi:large subunit ribosomal protein L33
VARLERREATAAEGRMDGHSRAPGDGATTSTNPVFLDFPVPAARVRPNSSGEVHMAKATTIKVKLVSSADTGFYYVTRKNSRTMTDKLVKKKYDPVAKKHVEFREAKIK